MPRFVYNISRHFLPAGRRKVSRMARVMTARNLLTRLIGLIVIWGSLSLVHPGICLGQTNYALRFDGVDDYVVVPGSVSLNPTAAVSMEAWIYLEDASNWQQGIAGSWDDIQGNFRTYHLWIESGKGDWHVGRGGPWTHAKDTISFPIKQWTHIAGTYDGAILTLYVNGQLRMTANFTGPIGTNTLPFYIGRSFTGSNEIDYFNGMIDDLRVWNRALTQNEIQTRMYSKLTGSEAGLVGYWPFDEGSGPAIADLTTNHNDGILVNQTSWVLSGVTPPAPPEAPTNLTATSLCATRVALQWTDNSANESGFVIERQSGGGSWLVAATAPANSSTWIVNGLPPQSTHTFRVKAVNSYSPSAYSNTAQAGTGSFSAPTNCAATSLGHNTVMLRWNDNSICESGFIIDRMTAPTVWSAIDTVAEGTIEATIGDLQPGTEYEFRVVAFDGSVHSDYSNTASTKTKNFLPPPTNFQASVLTATQAQLSWTDNAADEVGYEIEQRPPAGAWVLVHTTTADATTDTRSGLTPDSTYYFHVRAIGLDAASDWTEERSVVMTAPPDAPSGFIALAVDYQSARLRWTPGSSNETGYEIERREEAGSWVAARNAGRGDTAATDDGLKDLTTYAYRVRARNGAGASDWSNEATVTTLSLPKPGMPFGVSAAAIGPTTIRISWLEPAPPVEAGFEIEESQTGNEGDYVKLAPDAQAGARAYIRQSLKPQTAYWYRLRAYNKSGFSEYSKTASATTTEALSPPVAPSNLAAAMRSSSEIQLTWEIADSTFVESFVLERSLSGIASDFVPVAPDPPALDRTRSDTGLNANTLYYYRIKAVNTYGSSPWSNIASARTRDVSVTAELLAALNAKDSLIGKLEVLIPEGSADMQALRRLAEEYPRGYDESSARALIADLSSNGSREPAKAAEAMRRYTLAEQALLDVYGSDATVPGAKEMAREAMMAPALCAKDLAALALLWKDERPRIPASRLSRYDAVMDDLSFAVFDGERVLSSLVGMNAGGARLYAEAVKNSGDVPSLATPLLLSMIPYYQERFLGGRYFDATQFLIGEYAQRTQTMDAAGSFDSAATKVARHVVEANARTTELKAGFTSYANALTILDAASSIGTSGNVDVGIFLRKMMALRPRLFENTRKAIAGGSAPILRAAYLTSPSGIPAIGSLPFTLRAAAEAAFDPVANTVTGGDGGMHTSANVGASTTASAQSAIDDDRAGLLVLRTKVIEKDTAYIDAKFEELRVSGRGAIANLGRMMRPLDGITPEVFASDATLMNGCLDAASVTHRASALRAVLSTALADYLTDLSDTKNASLVAEIDTILGYYDQATNAAATVLPNIAPLVTDAVPSLESASLHPVIPSTPLRHRLRFTMGNAGGKDAQSMLVRVTALTPGVVPVSADSFSLGPIARGDVRSDSMDVLIPPGTAAITVAVAMSIDGGRGFVDHATVLLPSVPTTGIGHETPTPAAIALEQNHPNPFNSSTTISYSLSRQERVVLRVYNLLGRLVATLADGIQSAGSHAVAFKPLHIENGIYMYVLAASGQTLSRRMLLSK